MHHEQRCEKFAYHQDSWLTGSVAISWCAQLVVRITAVWTYYIIYIYGAIYIYLTALQCLIKPNFKWSIRFCYVDHLMIPWLSFAHYSQQKKREESSENQRLIYLIQVVYILIQTENSLYQYVSVRSLVKSILDLRSLFCYVLACMRYHVR